MSAFYFPDGTKRCGVIDAKRDSLLKPVACVDGRPPAEIAFHTVIPEALAAWYDYVIHVSDGGPRLDGERVARPVAIVDIGGRTTDYVVVEGQALRHTASGSVQRGLLDVKAALAEAIQQRFNLEVLDERQADQALCEGRVRLFGRDHDLTDVVDAGKRTLLEALYDDTRRKLGNAVALDTVHFVGGGAIVLADVIQSWFPHSSIASHPALANARGMLKFLRYVCDEAP
jgi:plasmid segregation protein ParM